jgi:hypothetical protein
MFAFWEECTIGYSFWSLKLQSKIFLCCSAGGVLFKVYIVGDQTRVVRRFSLPDVQEGKDACSGAIPFPRVSNAAATAEEADLDPQAAGKETLFTCFLGSHLCIGSVLVWSNRVG